MDRNLEIFKKIILKIGYFIESVDVQGAYTEIHKNDISQGILMAEEVLGMTLADLIESSEDIPTPTPMGKIKVENGFATMVTVNIEEYIRDMKLIKKIWFLRL